MVKPHVPLRSVAAHRDELDQRDPVMKHWEYHPALSTPLPEISDLRKSARSRCCRSAASDCRTQLGRHRSAQGSRRGEALGVSPSVLNSSSRNR